MPWRAVLFDLFDTLCRVDETAYREGQRAEARLLGVPEERFAEAWFSTGDAAQTGALPDLEARFREVCSRLGTTPGNGVLGAMIRREGERLLSGTHLHDDAVPALEGLRALRPAPRIGLVSNASSSATAVFAALGLRPFFDGVVFSCDVGVVKPHPRIYRAACDAIAVAPADCLFVGDGNALELDGAQDAGMTAVLIRRPIVPGPYRKGESTRYDFAVDRLTEIVPLVRG